MSFNAQVRFAKQLAKQKVVTAKQLPMKRTLDVPMSSEMVDWLQATLETDPSGNELGLPELKDDVGSVLIQPLDSMSVYCPVGAIMTNKLAAARSNAPSSKNPPFPTTGPPHDPFEPAYATSNLPSPNQLQENSLLTAGASFGFNATMAEGSGMSIGGGSVDAESFRPGKSQSSSVLGSLGQHSSMLSTWAENKKPPQPEPALPIDYVTSRLQVMWLQRRAQFEREEGNLDGALETLSDALALHLGPAGTDYEKANLSQHQLTDPSELLDYIADTYVSYDKTAHFEAGRIQRCFRRYMRRLHKMATRIQAFYRMFLVRLADWQKGETRKQCVQLIQRRYRRRLAMLRACATRIKRWYKTLKQQEEYKKRLFIYRKARAIQRLWRGNKNREISWQRRCEKYGNMLIQRQTRSYNSRRKRTLAIKFYHRMLFHAAVVIQKRVRSIQAVRRAQLQLLLELAREEDRLSREEQVVHETVKVQIAKTRLYMRTDAGREHMRIATQRIRLQDREFHKSAKSKTKEEIMAREAMVSFEMFDSDGSGLIDSDELAGMLQELSIPTSAEELDNLMKEINTSGSGEIDFGEFLEWYTGGGGEDAAEGASMAQQAFRLLLQARHAVLELSGAILRMRAERSILRQATAWLTKDITATFRNTHAPKFQCCQCMEPFVLFTDYYCHFDENTGFCQVVNEKAMFFRKFYDRKEWKNQREVEHEMMRVNDEIPNISYHTYMACVADLSLLSDAGVQEAINRQVRAAQILFVEKANADGEKINMKAEMTGSINVCKDNLVSSLTAIMVGRRLGRKLPDEWITHDRWDFDEFSSWFGKIIDEDVSKRRYLLAFTARGKLRQDCRVVADLHVRTIRLLQVAAEASLFGLLDARSRRPRRVTMTDDELRKAGLDFLTETQFQAAKDKIIERLRVLNLEMHKILTVRVPKRCAPKKKLPGMGDPQIGPDGLLAPDALRELLIHEAHVIAEARFGSRARSPVGRVQLSRLSYELWARRKILRDETPRSLKEAELRFVYERFASAETGDGIDFHDFALAQRSLALRVKEVMMDTLRALLDPEKTGFITFEKLLAFMTGSACKQYRSLIRIATNGLGTVAAAARNALYLLYARQLLVSKMRKVSRLELDYRTTSLQAQLIAVEIAPEALQAHREKAHQDKEAAKKAALSAAAAEERRILAATAPWILIVPDKPTPSRLPKLPNEIPPPAVLSPEEEAKAMALQIALKKMDSVIAEAEEVNDKLQVIRTADEATENLLLYRMEEEEAERKCLRRMLMTRDGLRDWSIEKMVMEAVDTVMESYGVLIPPGASYPWSAQTFGNAATRGGRPHSVAWDLTLAVLVFAFDTDCSGSFDEGEVRLLLRCAFCSLGESRILYHFPEVRLDSASLDAVVDYLAPRVNWRRGWLHRLGRKGRVFISKSTSWQASASLLVSLSRQLAREKAVQATALARTGNLLEEDDDKNDDALMMRSQMFAMRQVRLFLKTSQGRIQYLLTKKKVKHWWREDCWRTGFSREGVLRYAFLLHAEKGAVGEILNTELPHLLRYLVVVCGFKTTERVAELAELMAKIKTKADVEWLQRERVLAMLDPMLQPGSIAMNSPSRAVRVAYGSARLVPSCSSRQDTATHMTSRARQQAVLVALGFEGIFVAETNYRCSILGLHEVMRLNRQAPPASAAGAMDWKSVPKEATPYLLLSSGYTLDDMRTGDVPNFAELDHRQGGLALERVDVKLMLRTAREQTEPIHSTLQGAFRWARWMVGLPRYLEYRRYAKVIALQRKQLDEAGAMYLREVLKGQSHCVKLEEEDD